MIYFSDYVAWIDWVAVGQIIMIDLLLSGDNAILIALACRDLPASQRKKGIFWGAAGAVLLRLLLAAFAMVLLTIPGLKILGGLLLLGISIKMMLVKTAEQSTTATTASTAISTTAKLSTAIKTIIIADFAMSMDNVIGIIAAAETADASLRLFLIVLGLLMSSPLIIWGSQWMLKLIDRFPIIVPIGAAMLGWIGGKLIISDIFMQRFNVFKLPMVAIIAGIVGALLVVVAGNLWKWKHTRA